jgi:hypothetical protein
MEELAQLKAENPLISRVLYSIRKYPTGEEEIRISGYDMGARMYIVKWLDSKNAIVKRRSTNVLCGARGCGMVFPFPTKYYLVKILDEQIPSNWNAWTGYCNFTHEIEAGRNWKKGIEILKEIYKNGKS